VALYIPSGSANVIMEFSIAGDSGPALTTFGVTDVQAVNPDDIAEGVADAYSATDSIQGYVNGSCSLISVSTYKNVGSDVIALGSWVGNRQGTGPGSASPPQVTWLFHKLTGFGGRQQRGRMFLPGVSEQYVADSGLIESGAYTGISAAAGNFLAAVATNAGPMTVLHTNPAVFLQEVTTLQVAPKVATQRRRLR